MTDTSDNWTHDDALNAGRDAIDNIFEHFPDTLDPDDRQDVYDILELEGIPERFLEAATDDAVEYARGLIGGQTLTPTQLIRQALTSMDP